MDENGLIIYNNGIIGKIKRLFGNLFKKKNKVLLLPETTQNQEKKIKEEIVIPLDKERERIIKLQRKFQNKEIEEKDLSIEDKEKIKKLYNTQIKDLKSKIGYNISETERYKTEIIEIRLKL